MQEMVTIYIDGLSYFVPKDLTIMTAMEYVGLHLIKGVGCRQGFCGACSTVYRLNTDHNENNVNFCLGCQTKVEEGMNIATLPTFPLNKKIYNLEELQPTTNVLATIFPEIEGCVECEACTNSCPKDLKVMDYIAAARDGDLEKCAEEAYACISCGICSTRCVANISHPLVATLARRLVARYNIPISKQLAQRVNAVENGEFDTLMEDIISKSNKELEELYNTRVIEV